LPEIINNTPYLILKEERKKKRRITMPMTEFIRFHAHEQEQELEALVLLIWSFGWVRQFVGDCSCFISFN